MKIRFLLLFVFFSFQTNFAQQTQNWGSSEIYQAIEKLNFLGSVLYVAAHPDDENTQLISYFSNETNARTAYLSLTRGDGGQNLIGPEMRELLGVIRTQELLSARRIDGGIQFFSRANDFGYSKTPGETLEIWNKKEVLSDVVWIVRNFRPDVIINRFDIESAGETHGHHTSSAMLSAQAFDLAGDKGKFPEQLQYVETWQPKRLYFNTSWWFYGSREKFREADKTGFATVDVGVYFPLKGVSNTEISAKSRSQHKSQGFGVSASRGTDLEYLEPVKGDFPKLSDSIFAGINTTWSRLENGKPIGDILKEVQGEYNFKNPSASIPKLLEAYQLIQNLEDDHWRGIKSKAIEKIILAASGVYLEVSSEVPNAVPGDEIEVSIEAINRSDASVKLMNVEFTKSNKELSPNKPLENNRGFSEKTKLQLPKSLGYSTPYWLNGKAGLGMYHVENQQFIGLPETPPILKAKFGLEINGIPLEVERPVIFKTTDPVKGEVRKPLNIVPKVSVSMTDDVVIFPTEETKSIFVSVRSFQDNVNGNLSLGLPENWRVSPKSIEVSLPQKGTIKLFSFEVTPPENQSEAYVSPEFTINGETYSKELVKIDYPHIQQKNVLLPSRAKLVRLDIKTDGEKIGYIEGAGDVVAESLGQMGYEVETLSLPEITLERLAGLDAVVVGIRAYNVREGLGAKQDVLFEYVKNGGNLIVQYNKSFRLKTDKLAPYPLELSRDRVTNENSEVVFLAENHPVLNIPNKITKADFEGWVQERGLYFPNEWGGEFTPILGMKDKGEPMTKGSLLVAKYGKGYYIYTGLSFFRELPAGVSGAYRLFANMIGLGSGN